MKIPKWVVNLVISKILRREKMDKIKAMLEGKKTYLSALALVIAALVQFSADGNAGELINKIIEAIALCSIRSAVS